MKLESLFSTPLFEDVLNIDNEPLINFCYNHKNQFTDREDISGYQSLSIDLTNQDLEPLLNEIQFRINKIKNDYYSLQDELSFRIINSWFNINYANGRCQGPSYPHLHAYRFLTCVYYPKVSQNCGNLVLMAPNPIVEYVVPYQSRKTVHEFNSSIHHIEPKTSQLIIFPGWIMHYVEQNKSNEDRISMVFNVSLDPLSKLIEKIY